MANGVLYLFHQTPGWKTAAESRAFTDQVTCILQNHGFSVTAVSHKNLRPAPAVCIRAEAKSSATHSMEINRTWRHNH
ncbi:MAG: hypothetical protein ACRDJW_00850 [Thermomicrobiales bacterium]